MRVYVEKNWFNYFHNMQPGIGWIIKVKIIDTYYFTLWFDVISSRNIEVLKWNNNIIMFSKIKDLVMFISSNNSTNFKNAMVYNEEKISLLINNKIESSKAYLSIDSYDLRSFLLLKRKKWSNLDLNELNNILDDTNMLVDFYFSLRKEEPKELSEFLDYITFILNSERKNLDSFDKKLIVKIINDMLEYVIEHTQIITRAK